MLRTAAGEYADFWKVTDDALRYTAKSLQVSLTGAQHDDLMDSYNKLPPWPDVREELTKLRRSGIRMAFWSNFTAAMLDANLEGARLGEFFERHLTTDLVRAYKPSPRAYQMGLDRFLLQKHAIAFAAFAAWDAAGASWFGYPTIWVNRTGSSEEELQSAPHAIVRDLRGLTKLLGAP